MRPLSVYFLFIFGFLLGILGLYFYSVTLFSDRHGLEVFQRLTWDIDRFPEEILNHLQHPLGKFLTQLLVILGVAKLFAYLVSRVGIPQVIGEIFGGLFLGPSFIGYFFPGFFVFLFPEDSFLSLKLVSQLGLIFFMFLIGLETDWKNLHGKIHSAIVISHASIIFPFFLGIILSYYIFESLAPKSVSFLSFSLFMGIAMSITAFPVLAKIIQEKNLSKEKSGILAITCAAADDVTAWLLLAVIIGITSASSLLGLMINFSLILVFLAISFLVVRKFFHHYTEKYIELEYIPKPLIFFIFFWLTFSSLFTEVMGIHALFGAFIAGSVISPSYKFRSKVFEKMEDLTIVYLLPLFFAYSGLKTEIGLLNSLELLFILFLIILVAILGKLGGSFLAAKILGESWKDSLFIGLLMNTRGLMELIVLNIGYEMGIISPEIFTMMVIMALVTTLMTGPMLTIVGNYFDRRIAMKTNQSKTPNQKTKILISFAKPSTGIHLTKLAFKLFPNSDIVCFHVNQNYGIDIEKADNEMGILYENLRFISENEGIPLEFQYSLSENFEQSLLTKIEELEPHFLLFGSAQKSSWNEIYKSLPKKIFHLPNSIPSVFTGANMEFIQKFFVLKKDKEVKEYLEKLGCDLDKIKSVDNLDGLDNHTDLVIRTMKDNENITIENNNYLILPLGKRSREL
jgi:Kef-type K+ transport system membrane component KefB